MTVLLMLLLYFIGSSCLRDSSQTCSRKLLYHWATVEYH